MLSIRGLQVVFPNGYTALSDVTFGVQPKHINIYHRNRLGWVDVARQLTLSSGGTVSNIQLDAAESSGSASFGSDKSRKNASVKRAARRLGDLPSAAAAGAEEERFIRADR